MTWADTAGIRGKVAELLVAAYCMEMGWDVYFPVREDSQCDLLINCIPHVGAFGMERIQVKRIYMKDGHPTINLKRKDGSRYDITEIDLIAAVNVDTRFIWLIPFEELQGKKQLPLGRLRITKKWDRYILEAPHGKDG